MFITDETHLVGCDGVVRWGLDEITSNTNQLPPGLILQIVNGPNPDRIALVAHNATYFRDEIYKSVNFV